MIAGRYALEAEIGRGGMGSVWRARDEVLGRTVALKRIGVASGASSPDLRRAQREARLAARLNHPNVVAVFDLVESDGEQWLVMEHVEGTDLAALVRRRGRLDPDRAAVVLAQVAAALGAAHDAGIVHRDVKPSNILVAADGRVKLSDFGIARGATDAALTSTGLVTGSPAYLAPEVASGRPAGATADVWSWGASLFHAVEGHPPYQTGDNVVGALYRIVQEEPPRPHAAGWLAPAVEATMVRDPADRWSIAQARAFLERGPMAPGAPADPATDAAQSTRELQVQPAPAASWRRRMLVAMTVAATAVAIVLGYQHGLDRGAPEAEAGSGSGSSTSSSPSTAADSAPSAAAMESFVRDYISTAVDDAAVAYESLTPAFQRDSGGLERYAGFWDEVRQPRIETIRADPSTLRITYTWRYQRGRGRPETDDVTLVLQPTDGGFLIADEL